MNEFRRAKLAIKYIFFELVPVFIMGLFIFMFVLVMFQSFKLSEYVIVQGADFDATLKLLFFMLLQYLPILIPIALLFAILLTYSRLSNDSEIVALKALGRSAWHLLIPPLILGVFVTLFATQVSFKLAPWGERNMDVMVEKLAQMKPGVTIREGVFSEGFFKLVVYANKISEDGILRQVFIYDERNKKSPMTIIAKEGQVLSQRNSDGNRAYLRLKEGNIHKNDFESYTKIDFENYDINLFSPHKKSKRDMAPDGLFMNELRQEMKRTDLDRKQKMNLHLTYFRRWSLSFTSIIFAFVAMTLGTVTNRRAARSGSLVISISVIVVYWIFHIGFESMARNDLLPISIACWMTNILFLIFGMTQFRKLTKV